MRDYDNLDIPQLTCKEWHDTTCNPTFCLFLFAIIMIGLIKNVVPKLASRTKNAFHPKNLIYTNMTLSAGISGLGDGIEQQVEQLMGKIKQYHSKRTVNMTVSGLSLGVVGHYWYLYLDKRIKGKTMSAVVKKVVFDQIIGTPLGIGVFFLTMAALEESSLKDLMDEVRNKAWKLYAAEIIIWCPAQFVNFYFLPGKYRVLYDNTVSLVSDIYYSAVKHDKMEVQ